MAFMEDTPSQFIYRSVGLPVNGFYQDLPVIASLDEEEYLTIGDPVSFKANGVVTKFDATLPFQGIVKFHSQKEFYKSGQALSVLTKARAYLLTSEKVDLKSSTSFPEIFVTNDGKFSLAGVKKIGKAVENSIDVEDGFLTLVELEAING